MNLCTSTRECHACTSPAGRLNRRGSAAPQHSLSASRAATSLRTGWGRADGAVRHEDRGVLKTGRVDVPTEALARLIPAVEEAGEIGLRFVRDGAKTFTKHDASPVTEADLAIDAHLAAAACADLSPTVGWLSEETCRQRGERLGKRAGLDRRPDRRHARLRRRQWRMGDLGGARRGRAGRSPACSSARPRAISTRPRAVAAPARTASLLAVSDGPLETIACERPEALLRQAAGDGPRRSSAARACRRSR